MAEVTVTYRGKALAKIMISKSIGYFWHVATRSNALYETQCVRVDSFITDNVLIWYLREKHLKEAVESHIIFNFVSPIWNCSNNKQETCFQNIMECDYYLDQEIFNHSMFKYMFNEMQF
jgi:hypothetical protein